MARKNKRRHLYGRKEFLFNFFSLIIVIGIGIYFGYRSLYYYSKQHMVKQGNNQTLSEVIINSNRLITDGDGFHKDHDGYYFKGNVVNNYVSFANRKYRIIRINNDGSIKLITDENVASFLWGDETSYSKSNVHHWLEKTEEENSGTYYETIPNITKFLVKTDYQENILKDEKVKKSDKTFSDYVTTLTIDDYVTANGKNSYLNNGKIFYLLGLNADKNNLYIEDDGAVTDGDNLSGYGIRAVITLNKNVINAFGDGSVDNPYTVQQGKDTNYVNTVVKLGEDNWKVYREETDKLRLVKMDYIKENDQEVIHQFSKKTNTFDLEDKTNIAVYLNNNYLNSLSYKDLIVDNTYYTGETSTDTGYSYKNIYSNQVTCKVALLNVFDYNSNEFNDFFYMNTIQGVLQYVGFSSGLLEEAEITEEKHIVPVISIDKNIIKDGKGTLTEPYTVG